MGRANGNAARRGGRYDRRVNVTRAERLSDLQIDRLTELYQDLFWSRGRSRVDVAAMLENSLVVALLDGDALVAFARVITDGIYKALVLDVVVDPGHRRAGLGRRVIDELLSDPRLARVAHFELYCAPEMVEFYERWGFTTDVGGLAFMRAQRPLDSGHSQD